MVEAGGQRGGLEVLSLGHRHLEGHGDMVRMEAGVGAGPGSCRALREASDWRVWTSPLDNLELWKETDCYGSVLKEHLVCGEEGGLEGVLIKV